MRAAILVMAMVAVLGTGAPAAAQSDPLDRRVRTLESEMRAVQRKVFPGGDRKTFEPEFGATDPATAVPAPGTPASAPITDLTQRVDALERQLAQLTGQVEQATFRQRQLDEAMAKFRGDVEFRLTQIERGGATPGAATAPGDPNAVPPFPFTPPPRPADAAPTATDADATDPAVTPAPPAAASDDPIEDQWNAAYALVNAKDYAKAEPALQAIIAEHPTHRRGASAMFWLGRVYYAQNSYAQAAKSFLQSYQKHPKELRGPDSLYWLGQSLAGLERPTEACQAYNELQAVYGAKISASLKAQLTSARTASKCAA